MDLCLSRDLFESFFLYQERLKKEFDWMAQPYAFHDVDANRAPSGPRGSPAVVAPLYGTGTGASARRLRGGHSCRGELLPGEQPDEAGRARLRTERELETDGPSFGEVRRPRQRPR